MSKKSYITPAASAYHFLTTQAILAVSGEKEEMTISSENSGNQNLSHEQGWSSESWN